MWTGFQMRSRGNTLPEPVAAHPTNVLPLRTVSRSAARMHVGDVSPR